MHTHTAYLSSRLSNLDILCRKNTLATAPFLYISYCIRNSPNTRKLKSPVQMLVMIITFAKDQCETSKAITNNPAVWM